MYRPNKSSLQFLHTEFSFYLSFRAKKYSKATSTELCSLNYSLKKGKKQLSYKVWFKRLYGIVSGDKSTLYTLSVQPLLPAVSLW